MASYIFFRTDRIGDLLISSILFKAIKRSDFYSHITVVTSNKNYKFAKSLSFIDEVKLYPTSCFKKFFFFVELMMTNYDLSCVLDGKKRSIFLPRLRGGHFGTPPQTLLALTTKSQEKPDFSARFSRFSLLT